MGVLLMSKKDEGFKVSREEKKKIIQWMKNHEAKCHGRYKGSYFYEFYPCGNSDSASVVCAICYRQNFVKAKGNLNRYEKLMGKCGGFFAFRRLGQ